ncbi:hypothetical protein Ciccas_003109 [Cichlidogyrus casuarinus]|uniref:Uncharacterized protein n=1 Tax=Cichlidogyrus casuarinus TaxID=1844966 RepID=A0ABD2QFS6_9PLAT
MFGYKGHVSVNKCTAKMDLILEDVANLESNSEFLSSEICSPSYAIIRDWLHYNTIWPTCQAWNAFKKYLNGRPETEPSKPPTLNPGRGCTPFLLSQTSPQQNPMTSVPIGATTLLKRPCQSLLCQCTRDLVWRCEDYPANVKNVCEFIQTRNMFYPYLVSWSDT